MQIDAVVINASPLITLFRSGQADLLPQLFKRIVVPQAVWQEVVQDDWDDPPARALRQQSWPVLESVDISPRVAAWSLGAGESAVLSYAQEDTPSSLRYAAIWRQFRPSSRSLRMWSMRA